MNALEVRKTGTHIELIPGAGVEDWSTVAANMVRTRCYMEVTGWGDHWHWLYQAEDDDGLTRWYFVN